MRCALQHGPDPSPEHSLRLAEASWSRRGDHFVKRYPLAGLSDRWSAVVRRLSALEAPPGPGVLVHTTKLVAGHLVVSTPWLSGARRLTPGELLPFLPRLTDILDRNLTQLGPHGDLAWDNLMVDPTGELWLVDWEPSCRRFKGGRIAWMTRTHHPADRQAGILSRRTDLLGFLQMACRELSVSPSILATNAVDEGACSFGDLLAMVLKCVE